MKPNDFEYLSIVCEACGDTTTLAKNKGDGDWKAYDHALTRFLVVHGNCEISEIRLEGELVL